MPIQGIDAGALINAFRQGRADRKARDEETAAQERQKRISDVMDRMYDDGSTGTIGDYASPAPRRSNFEAAFGTPQENGLMATPEQQAQSEALSQRHFGRPDQPEQRQPRAPQAPARRPNPNVLAELIALDPETGSKIVSAFKTMDETNLKALETKNTVLGAASRWLEGVPEQQRGAALQQIAPQLIAAGWTPEEIMDKPLTTQALRGYQSQAIDLDKMIDNELAEREFQAGKVLSVQPGGMAVRIRPEGSNEVIVAPGGGQVSAPTNLAQPQSKADYEALPPGSRYLSPDGQIRTKGGAGSNASGNFRGD